MDDIARMPAAELRDLFTQAANRYGSTPEVMEKDFWVTWTLKHIFDLGLPPAQLIFKGGTSLSKVYGLIERFSEDIDLSLSREDLGFGGEKDPYQAPSRKKQDALVEELVERCKEAIANELLPRLRARFASVIGEENSGQRPWSLALDSLDAQTVNFGCPAGVHQSEATLPGYLKPIVRLELGARSDHWPAEDRVIRPLIDEAMPGVVNAAEARVRVLSAERTFWEKATLLHAEYHRPPDKPSKERLTRHYYDVVRLYQSQVGENALNQAELLQAVVRHKMLFFRSAWANYEGAQPGSFRLVPPAETIPRLKADYAQMQEVMIFGDSPTFDELLEALKHLEARINRLPA